MDRFNELRAFVSVAESGGFARAAKALNSSPPAITRAIAALEDRLGARLFNRTTRRVQLTETGVRFLDDARRVLSDLDTAEQEVRGEARLVSGTLTITASVSFGRTLLQPMIGTFIDAYPLVNVTMLLFDRVVDLVEEGFDLAVRIGALPDTSFVATRVGEVRRMLVASPDYVARRGVPSSPRELRTHTIIGHTTLLANREWRHVESGKPARTSFEPRIETNDAHTSLALAHQGKGIAVALSYMIAADLSAGRLVPVLETHTPPPLPVHLIYAQSRMITPKVRAFLDFAAPRLRIALAQA